MKTPTLIHLRTSVLAIVMLLLCASPAWAQGIELSEEQKMQMAEQQEQAKERLQLTEEQQEAIAPILENSMAERLAIMEEYGINPSDPDFKRPGMRTMRKMRKDMDRLDSNTRKQLENHLSDEQMDTWDELQKERKDRMRQQMQNR